MVSALETLAEKQVRHTNNNISTLFDLRLMPEASRAGVVRQLRREEKKRNKGTRVILALTRQMWKQGGRVPR